MNPGYLTLIITWFLILLTWIGVFDQYLVKQQIKKWRVQCYLLLALLGSGITVPLPRSGQLSLVAFVLPLLVALWLWMKEEDSHRIHLITASFLIGTSVFLLRLLLQMDPILMVMNEQYMQVSLILFLLFVAARGLVQQYVLLTFGVSMGEIGFQYYMWKKTGGYQLGSYVYNDVLWLTIILLIFVRLILVMVQRTGLLRKKGAETT